jgi:D-threo-aldose 1-dehydrogenase
MSIAINTVTYGTATLGNLFHEMSPDEARAILEAAWSAGIRHYDSAPHYGLGLAEQRLGEFLATVDASAAFVTTKVGRLLEPNPDYAGELDEAEAFMVPAVTRRRWDPSLAGVRASVESSMERIGIDHFDALYLHDPDENPDEFASLDTGLGSLATLRAEGLVDRIGVGSKSTEILDRAAADSRTSQIMIAGRFTLLDTSTMARCLPLSLAHDIRLAPAAVYASGLLARPEPAGHYIYQDAPPEILDRARAIAAVCTSHGTDLPTAALHYVARHPATHTVVIGARSVSQLTQTIERLSADLPEQLWADLAERGLAPDPAVVS